MPFIGGGAMELSDEFIVEKAEDCAPEAEENEVPQEADGDMKVVRGEYWEETEDDCSDDGENACNDGSDL